MESYGSLPVGKWTRSMEAEMYRKIHEEIKRKKNLQGDGKLVSLETCSEEVNLGNEGNIGKNVLALSGGEKRYLASQVKSKKAGVGQCGVRRRSNVSGRTKKKKFSAPRKKMTGSASRLQCDDDENDFVYLGEREVGGGDVDTREIIIIGDDEDGEREEDDGASREQRFSGVSSVGGIARRTRSRCRLQFNYTQSHMVDKEKRKEGEGEVDAERNELIDIGDAENGNDEKVEELNVEEEDKEKDEACSDDGGDDMKEDSDDVVNEGEEGWKEGEGELDAEINEVTDIGDAENGNDEKVEELNVEEEEEDKEKDEACSDDDDTKEDIDDVANEGEGYVERNEFVIIHISDDENGSDEKVEELNVEEEEEEEDDETDEDCSDEDNDDTEDSDYVVTDAEEGNSDDEEVDVSFKSCKDGGDQNYANSYVICQDYDVEKQEDEKEESQTLGNEPVDHMDIDQCKFVKSNAEKPDFVAMRNRSHSSLASLKQKVSDGSMESSAGEGDFGAGKCQVNDDTVRSPLEGKSDDVGKQKVKHDTIRNPRKRKRRYDPLKDHEFEKILVASILKNGNENLPFEEIIESPSKPTLPLKFTFGVEEPPSDHKELEKDEGILQLWDEMALSLNQNDVHSDQMEENEPETRNDVRDTAFCSQGNHQFVLDEEIGIVCQRCSYVRLEIRYYSPPMSKYPWGRSERREYLRSLNKFPDDFRYEDFEFNSESGLSQSPDLQGTVWSLVPGVRRGMHAHQVEGFEFLWKNIAGDIHLEDLKEPVTLQSGSGCVISHAPGTGKTRLTIAFLQTYMKLYPSCKPVIIAPTSMLQTWESEFSKWQVEVPFLNLNDPKLVGNEHKGVLKLLEPGNYSSHLIRLIKLLSWKLDGGVLALSYKLFVELTSRRPTEHDSAWKSLLDRPGLLILDEGHTPRNNCSIMWKALSKIKTWRKIILSGTPFQNNFDELFNIFCLIRPNFADKKTSGPSSARGWESRAKAKWASLTSQIEQSGDNDRLNKAIFDRLWREIAPFVHVHKGSILQRKLPGLKDSLVLLEPLEMQKDLLKKIDDALTDRGFNWEQSVTLVCVHPSLLRSKLHIPSFDVVDRKMLESVQSDPEAGAKTKFVMELIRLCDLIGEKVLVFSQFIPPLNMIIKLLEAEMHWREGREILVIQGQTETDRRQTSIRDFNDPRSESRIMLASTKACSEGISLVGASRVVLLDVGWNPSAERQAICRAYRLGQEKVVHVYHLLASGTNEEEKYGRQAAKYRCSELLFQSADPSDHDRKMPPTFSDVKDKVLEQMVGGDKLKHIIKKVISIERF